MCGCEYLPDGGMRVRAAAKLNLMLSVLGRRDDGFHELDSIIAKVTLYDELLIRPRDDGEICLRCGPFDCGPVQKNLVCRAAELLRGPQHLGANIELIKRIPPGAGLGGGSSDAAAALTALNDLWGLGFSKDRLAELGAELGSDVPVFLGGPAARVRGRGEQVEQVQLTPFWAVLCIPDLACPTGKVYSAWDALDEPAPAPVAAEALIGPPSQWGQLLYNNLRAPAQSIRPELARVEGRLAHATARAVHLSGSGSAMFILADDESQAHTVAARLPDDLAECCRIVRLNPW